jgi:hypothetical protein
MSPEAAPNEIQISDLRGASVREFALRLRRGEIVGVTGLVGSGFDDVGALLFGERRAAAGMLRFDGHEEPLSRMAPDKEQPCLAGVLYAGTTASADPTSGLALLLPAFAGAFLGSTTIQPGRFNAWGSFAAIYFLGTGINGLSLFGIQVFVQNLFYGGALIVAVSISVLARRRAGAS